MSKTLLVLDGHDGVGKTTLAALLAASLGGVHLRPFAGEAGTRMLATAETGNLRRAAAVARAAVDRTIAACDASVLVCDRHWMTAFTLLPESYWTDWLPLPPTTLCWVDLTTTLDRLAQRGEPQPGRAYHENYMTQYWELGQRFGCHVLCTDQATIETCLDRLIAWARPYLDDGWGGVGVTEQPCGLPRRHVPRDRRHQK